MIDEIYSSDNSLDIMGNVNPNPYVGSAVDDPRAAAGDVRYNGSSFEVFTGGSWMLLPSSLANIQISPRWKSVLHWAEIKMQEEEREKELLKKSPALQKAKDNYNTIKALVEND